MNVRVRVLRDTTDRLDGMDGRMDGRLERIAKRTAIRMRRRAKRACPWHHGKLRASIQRLVRRTAPFTYQAIVGVPGGAGSYGPYVEFGTGRRGRASHARLAAELWWGPITYRGDWPGQAAQPFLTPQPFAVKPDVDREIRQALDDEWNGMGAL